MDHLTQQRYDALLAVADSISQHRELSSLFQHLSEVLRPLLPFDFLVVVLYDEKTQTANQHTLVSTRPMPPLRPISIPLDESPVGWVIRNGRPLVIDDVLAHGHPRDIQCHLEDAGVRAVVFLPLGTAVRRIGALGLGAVQPGVYAGTDLEFLARVANQVAVAVDNALHSEEVETQRAELARERDRWRVLLEVNNALVSTLDLQVLLTALVARLRTVLAFELAVIALQQAPGRDLELVAHEIAGGSTQPLDFTGTLPVGEGSALGRAFATGKPLLVTDAEWDRINSEVGDEARRRGIRSGCAVPLVGPRRPLGAFIVAASGDKGFTPFEVDLLVQVGAQMAIAIENALNYRQVAELTTRLRNEKQYLENEIRSSGHFEYIIGASAGLRHVLQQVETVAPTDSTVLILGETGTGKELIARAIHEASPRRGHTFVRVNCAAIPSGLLESELFGHEKGAFTGALMRKVGRFELADGGTILLDEVGDIPLDLQPKLLRVLQEHEFERLGNSRSTKVDVRVLASTNRELQRMVDTREFRADLFYRLNVFPVALPPLRDRREDIPALVQHFVDRYAGRLKRTIRRIPAESMAALRAWSWPGNVRELENVIERAVILSRGETLEVPLPIAGGIGATAPAAASASGTELDSVERAHILKTLRETRWVIGGPAGAAERLGMKRTTLASRMRKLGIVRPIPE